MKSEEDIIKSIMEYEEEIEVLRQQLANIRMGIDQKTSFEKTIERNLDTIDTLKWVLK